MPKYGLLFPPGYEMTSRQYAWEFLRLNQTRNPRDVCIWLENELNRLEIPMAAKNAAKNKTSTLNEKANWIGYANINLSDDDKQAIKGGILDGDAVLEIIGEMLGTGHKIAITHDPEKDTISISATGVYTRCPNAGLTLTCFARSFTDGLSVLAYKHEIVAKGKWSSFVQGKVERDDIG